MVEPQPELRAIFCDALAQNTSEEQAEYLDRACQGKPELRARVEALLRAHQEASNFLQEPSAERAVTIDAVHEGPGTVIGPYKLLQQIGEGGMGTVFMAEQSQPVQRMVALKIIRPGMDSRQVIGRLEAERQALALMDHPNIARVIDAGTTASGLPYFVMELVKGVPITRYCDEHRLTPKQRLELFQPVCQAVQHAHQKGIIHRDLKPSNVLVAEYDDKPVAKVIDFGVAKAIGPKLTERTMFTEFGQVVGTLEYMSPEQAKLNALDIDTRSDIYALGVLLYELLTGTTPFSRKRLQQAAFDEMLRIIREEEPPRPSTRLSTTDELPSIAANRSLEPKKLSGAVKGELDWIVMKCLEKDRNRRYESANQLALEIQRHLHDEPVQAGPPSPWYRFRKFARRNRAGLAVASLVAAALVSIVAMLAINNRLLEGERANTAQQRDLAEGRRLQAEKAREYARQALDEMSSEMIEDWLGRQNELTPDQQQFLKRALESYQRFTEETGDSPEQQRALAAAHYRVATIHHRLGRSVEAQAAYQRSIELMVPLVRDHSSVPQYAPELSRAHHDLAILQWELGQTEAALRSHEAARALRDALVRDHPGMPGYVRDLARTYSNLGTIHARLSQEQAALDSFDAARGLQSALVRDQPRASGYALDLAVTQHNLGVVQARLGRREEALQSYEAARALEAAVLRDHPGVRHYKQELARTQFSIGSLQWQMGQLEAALRTQEAARTLRAALVRDYPGVPEYVRDLAGSHTNLGILQAEMGRLAAALESHEAARALGGALVRDHPDVPEYAVALGGTYCNLGALVRNTGRPQSALELFAQAIATLEPVWQKQPKLFLARRFLHNTYMERIRTLEPLGRHLEAVKDWDLAIACADAGQSLELRSGRALSLARAGQASRAVAAADELTQSKGVPSGTLYDLACVCSVASAAVDGDANLKRQYGARAVELIRRAFSSGFKDVDHMKKDPDLDPLRAREDFKTVLAELDSKKNP